MKQLKSNFLSRLDKAATIAQKRDLLFMCIQHMAPLLKDIKKRRDLAMSHPTLHGLLTEVQWIYECCYRSTLMNELKEKIPTAYRALSAINKVIHNPQLATSSMTINTIRPYERQIYRERLGSVMILSLSMKTFMPNGRREYGYERSNNAR